MLNIYDMVVESDELGSEGIQIIDLGDQRINKRGALLAGHLAVKPLASNPQACVGGWADTQTAYCFLVQVGIEWENSLAQHWEKSPGY